MAGNLKKYNDAFMEAFGVSESELRALKLKESEDWDSVGHIRLISALEDTFEIDMESDDIFEVSTYENGLVVLNKKYGIEF